MYIFNKGRIKIIEDIFDMFQIMTSEFHKSLRLYRSMTHGSETERSQTESWTMRGSCFENSDL